MGLEFAGDRWYCSFCGTPHMKPQDYDTRGCSIGTPLRVYAKGEQLLVRGGSGWSLMRVADVRPPWLRGEERRTGPVPHEWCYDLDRRYFESELIAASLPVRRYGLCWDPAYEGEGYWYCQSCRKEFPPLPDDMTHAPGCDEAGLLNAVLAFGPKLFRATLEHPEPGGPETVGLTPETLRKMLPHLFKPSETGS